MRFAAPFWLLLLPLLWLGLVRTSALLSGVTRGRKQVILLFRALILTLLVSALAGVQLVRRPSRLCAIFVLDVSESVAERERSSAVNFINAALRHKGSDDLVAVIAFARQPIPELAPMNLSRLPPLRARPDRSATDIAAALRLAMGLVPEGFAPRIVLFSDGNETMGDALSAALVAKSQGIPIDVVPLKPQAAQREVLLADVQMPSQVKRHQPFPVRLVLEATQAGKGIIRVDRDGVPVKEVPVRFVRGKNAVVLNLWADAEGVHRFRFILDGHPDSNPKNNIGLGIVRVAGTTKVLLAEGEKGDGIALAQALRANGIDAELVAQGQLPVRPEEWLGYDAVILANYPAWAMSAQQMKLLAGLVRESGMGLVMVGGEQAFLTGGYYGTEVAKVLPVDLEVRQRRVYPAATVVVVMDTSGSMNCMDQPGDCREAGHRKVDAAAHAAVTALKTLRPIDRFGVIVSGGCVEWLAPIQPASQRAAIMDKLSQRIAPRGGGIFVRQCLELAAKGMMAEATRSRHIILLADGNDCDEQDGSVNLARQLKAMGITVTAVSFGKGPATPFLQQLAQAGGGNFYVVSHTGEELPRLFVADVQIMTRSAIEEHPFIPRLAGSDEMLNGIDFRSMPPLFGYCVTSDKPFARTLMRTDKGDPLLAVGQFGLGSSVAFTSDASGRWGRAWLGWGEFGKLWANIVKSALRKAAHGKYALTVRTDKGTAVVELEAFNPRGEPVNLLTPEVRVSRPDGAGQTVVLQQEGMGRYVGRFAVSETGVYWLTVTEREGQIVRVYGRGLAVPYPSEYRFVRVNLPLLKRLAELTGGRVNPAPEAVFVLPQGRHEVATDIWHWCVVVALALLLLDIAVRRVVIGAPEVVHTLAQKLAAATARRRRRPAPQPAVTERLKAAKERARQKGLAVPAAVSPGETNTPPTREGERADAPTQQGRATETTARLLTVKQRKRFEGRSP